MGIDFTVIFLVDHHHGSQGAGSQAVDALEGKDQIFRRFPGFHLQPVLEIVDNSGASPHMTCRSKADLDDMFSPGLETEGLVERSHFVNIRKRDIETF